MSDLLEAAEGVSAGAREAWAAIATAPLPADWRRELTSNGFIEHDLRFYRDEEWLFSAVLNEGWVLWYARRPALRAGIVDAAAMHAAFPATKDSKKGEVLLRLHDGEAARALWDWTMAGA